VDDIEIAKYDWYILSMRLLKYEISASSSPRRFGSGSLPCRLRSDMSIPGFSMDGLLFNVGSAKAVGKGLYASDRRAQTGVYMKELASRTGESSTSAAKYGYVFAHGK
jgi:hypothetical protein